MYDCELAHSRRLLISVQYTCLHFTVHPPPTFLGGQTAAGFRLKGKRSVLMRSIEIRIEQARFADTLSAMREWLDRKKCYLRWTPKTRQLVKVEPCP